MHFPHDPVGLPGLATLAVGFIAFLVVFMLARRRGVKAPKSADNARSSASIVWIIVQGIGIGIAGFGPVDASLGSATTKAVIEGLAVLALMLSAVWLFDASSRAMGKNWALVARTRADGNLVQSGPFAQMRNPIYVALGCFMLAMAIAYGHTLNLLIAAPLYALGTGMRVRHEEMVLRATFPDYDAYAARVKRFVPGIL